MTGATVLRRFDALLATPVGTRSLAVVRILVGLVAAWHLGALAREALAGRTHHGRFHQPYVGWVAEIPRAPYTAVLIVGVLAALATSLGVLTRVAVITTAAVTAIHLAISTTHVHNNRAYLVTVLAVLAMSRCGTSLSVDAWWRRRRDLDRATTAEAWPLWLLRFECATVYAASGFSKLLDPDWFGGTVTWGRVITEEALVRSSPLPDAVVDLLVDRSFHTIAAKAIVATELFIAGGLWWRRTRPIAIAVAVVFHVSIEVSADVQLFSWLAIAVLVAWADPDLRWDRPRRWWPQRWQRSSQDLTDRPRVTALG